MGGRFGTLAKRDIFQHGSKRFKKVVILGGFSLALDQLPVRSGLSGLDGLSASVVMFHVGTSWVEVGDPKKVYLYTVDLL